MDLNREIKDIIDRYILES